VSDRQWYQAEIQWAVMVEGKQGLRDWEESVYLFQAEDRAAAFQKALDVMDPIFWTKLFLFLDGGRH